MGKTTPMDRCRRVQTRAVIAEAPKLLPDYAGRFAFVARALVRLGALAGLSLTLASCASVAGAGVVVGLIGLGALTHKCYDYIDVTVYDAAGRRTCNAEVFAEQGDDSMRLTSCYYT